MATVVVCIDGWEPLRGRLLDHRGRIEEPLEFYGWSGLAAVLTTVEERSRIGQPVT